MLSILADGRRDLPLSEADILVSPRLPADLRLIDWEKHTEIFMNAYEEAAAWIKKRMAEKDSKLIRIVDC